MERDSNRHGRLAILRPAVTHGMADAAPVEAEIKQFARTECAQFGLGPAPGPQRRQAPPPARDLPPGPHHIAAPA
jgi:hypothetical protein